MAKRSKASGGRRGRRPSPLASHEFGMEDTAEGQALLGTLADDITQAEACFRAGIVAGERDLGAALLEQQAGRLGLIPEAQGYLICRRCLAQCLADTGRPVEALAECEALARLDTGDSTVARFLHLDLLLTLRRFDDARAVCERYADDPASCWDYSRALVEFADGGDTAESRRFLAAAIEANPHVPPLMLAGEQIEHDMTLTPADLEGEAAAYVQTTRAMWLDVPGALSWLREHVDAGHEKPARPARPPTPAALEALAIVPQDDSEEWQMHVGRERDRTWVFHVVSADDGRLIAIDTTLAKPRGEDLWQTLSNVMRFPREGEPRRPAVVAMRPGVFPAAWARRFKQLGIRQEVREALPALDRALADVDERIAAAERARTDEAASDFDPRAVAAGLAALPLEPGEIWEADVRRTPAWVTGEGKPYRPWLTLVVSRTRDQVLVPEVAANQPDAEHLLRLVLRASREAGIRPERLEVVDATVAEELAVALEPAGIPVAPAADGLPVIEKTAESLAVAIAGADTLRPLSRVPGMTDDLQRGLYAAAAEFYRARPWRKLPSDTPLDIHGPDGRLVHAVVMGQSGVQQGLAIYEDRTSLAAALRGDERAAARSTSMAVMFGEAFEVAARDHDAIEQKGFAIAGPEAWPLVIRMDPGFVARPPLVWEVELITACLLDVVRRGAEDGLRP